MHINLGFIQFYFWKREYPDFPQGKGFWVRIYGYGIWISNSPLSFSERNGYQKIRKLPYGYRLRILKREY